MLRLRNMYNFEALFIDKQRNLLIFGGTKHKMYVLGAYSSYKAIAGIAAASQIWHPTTPYLMISLGIHLILSLLHRLLNLWLNMF